jgi:HEAT repeat protein
MNQLLLMLRGGDLRSDGEAHQVARIVLDNPALLSDLLGGLEVDEQVVRGRTAHALEKIARDQPEWLQPHLSILLAAGDDPLPMVRWHMAMIYADLALFEQEVVVLTQKLLEMLDDTSVFVRSWAISSLCIIAKLYPASNAEITSRISAYSQDESIAIRARVRKALEALLAPTNPLPAGWLKSSRITIDGNH